MQNAASQAQNTNMDSSSGQNKPKSDDGNEVDDKCIVKMRGLPWSVNVEDILSFLGDCNIKDGKDGIHLTMSPLGRPSGEAYIEFVTPEDAAKAVKKNREHMGHRYIEVFPTTRSEMDWVVSRCGMNLDNVMDEGCVRMRGLPYGCTKEEVASFFSDYTGRATGEAYVQFVNKENVEKALKKHMEKIGHRYIEIFRSSLAEVHSQTGPKMRSSVSSYGRSAPYDQSNRFGGSNRMNGPPPMSRLSRYRNDNDWDNYDDWNSMNRTKSGRGGGFNDNGNYGDTRHLVHMRGLPYRAIEDDIAMFFRPLEPVDIRIIYDKTERPSGEAVVEFASHEEAVEAMSRDKEHIQSRYIELFLDSVSEYKSDYNRQGGPGARSNMTRPQGVGLGSGRDSGPRGGFGNRGASRGQSTKPFMSSSGGGFRSNW